MARYSTTLRSPNPLGTLAFAASTKPSQPPMNPPRTTPRGPRFYHPPPRRPTMPPTGPPPGEEPIRRYHVYKEGMDGMLLPVIAGDGSIRTLENGNVLVTFRKKQPPPPRPPPPPPSKKPKTSSAPPSKRALEPPKTSSTSSNKKQKKKPKSQNDISPVDRQKSAEKIQAVNKASGGKNDQAAALAAAILRGVTMRPSGKWQAQLYFAGKSRYIGVFDTREKACLAYEIVREKLKPDKGAKNRPPLTEKGTEDLVNSARKAAFDGVNEKDPREDEGTDKNK